MIPVNEALQRILTRTSALDAINIQLSEALGYVLAEDVLSPIDMPPFDNSAMDGYAINEFDSDEYKVVAEIQAGMNASDVTLKPGEAARIFTGAMVPASATTVVKQEITLRDGETVKITEAFQSGGNIRKKAEQIQSGTLALEKATHLNAAAIGLIAMLGIDSVKVYRKPLIKLLVTGNELVEAGNELQAGQIYESNAITIISALKELGFDATAVRVADDYEATAKIVGELLQECDVLLTSGGISVGDYDFVGKAMEENGVRTEFYKVKQKPGKPLFFGSTDSCLVFALPGNPASALTCTYIYVFPALQKMTGSTSLHLEKRSLPMANSYTKRPGLTHYLKGRVVDGTVESLEHQSSSMLNSFALSNCLIVVPEEAEKLEPGDSVSVYILTK
ncbi:MAG: molybdopterin molybdotransferase MoeA [bacterium]|nr:molybdopterin molybdotransferase MoeA [bacterium]